MKYPTMFAIYFILKKINPEFVIESGVSKEALNILDKLSEKYEKNYYTNERLN